MSPELSAKRLEVLQRDRSRNVTGGGTVGSDDRSLTGRSRPSAPRNPWTSACKFWKCDAREDVVVSLSRRTRWPR